MTALRGAVESAAPVSRLHERQSYDPADSRCPPGARREPPWFGGGKLRGRVVASPCGEQLGSAHAVLVGPPAAQAAGSLGRAR